MSELELLVNPETGQRCCKREGYEFVGTIVAVFKTLDYQERIVVEMDRGPNGGALLHIFAPQQFWRIVDDYQTVERPE